MQEPRLESPEVQGLIVTEYMVSYSLKADNVDANTKLIIAGSLLESHTKSEEQIGRSVLTKALNRVAGSMTYGAIYVARLLLGRGDSYISYNTQVVDFRGFLRALPVSKDYAHHLSSPSPHSAEVVHTLSSDKDGTKVVLVTDVLSYTLRNDALKLLSPVELAMGFEVYPHPKTKKRPLFFQSAHPKEDTHGHKVRNFPVLPQFISNLPIKPHEFAPSLEREIYAAFALAIFYSDQLVDGLQGDTLWSKLQDWETRRPRNIGSLRLDDFALTMLENANNQALARAAMSRDTKVMRMSRKAAYKERGDGVGGEQDAEYGRDHREGMYDLEDETEFQVGGDCLPDTDVPCLDDTMGSSDGLSANVKIAHMNLPQVDFSRLSRDAHHLSVSNVLNMIHTKTY